MATNKKVPKAVALSSASTATLLVEAYKTLAMVDRFEVGEFVRYELDFYEADVPAGSSAKLPKDGLDLYGSFKNLGINKDGDRVIEVRNKHVVVPHTWGNKDDDEHAVKSIKLNDSYTADLFRGRDTVTVGCQHIPIKAVMQLHDAIVSLAAEAAKATTPKVLPATFTPTYVGPKAVKKVAKKPVKKATKKKSNSVRAQTPKPLR